MLDVVYRLLVGLVGLTVIVIGIVLLPAPGPGWAVIFLGLGILATEFESARKVLLYTRRKYQAWIAWLGRQRASVRLAVSTAVLLLVATCGWLFGAFAVVGGWIGIDWAVLESPLGGVL
ncbi:TIGR02611 family protein [Pseudonocardia acidicola]|uniref:TIGR02611 family protein n=1 Tax=Pseudonocardia acidicola TaxID=2724939 RepID=A0ABX1SKQ3_9PSEU|nr:TIGR02611 family protein [Pseudonocardia acidicola]NMI00850.1 TIGR02611 family protein [Pseudonocardia acidicola]